MPATRPPADPERDEPARPEPSVTTRTLLHPALHGAIALGVFVLLAVNVVRNPEGYPVSLMLGGLLAAFGGVVQAVRSRNGGDPS